MDVRVVGVLLVAQAVMSIHRSEVVMTDHTYLKGYNYERTV